MLCPNCGIGRLRWVQAPFFCQLDGEPVLVPQVPALNCDICGETRPDPDFIQWLEMLVNSRPVRGKAQRPASRTGKRRSVIGGAQGGMRELGS
ncbi:MAG: hypothetical protein R3300_21880 [Candidatus Promineifilaceae bacterium]|nr:hypothetical protein [Candidatus Promineifilaceae bacterium]